MNGNVNTLGDEGKNFWLTLDGLSLLSKKNLHGDLLTGTKVRVK